MAPARFLLPVLGLCACDRGGDGDSAAPMPDVAGQYQFFVDGVSTSNLCEEEEPYVTDWLRGSLAIAGTDPDDVTFTFSDGMTFSGGVDDLSYYFGGDATWDGAALEVSHHGIFVVDGGVLTLGGDFEVVVDDDEFTTNNCIIEVRISGQRISE